MVIPARNEAESIVATLAPLQAWRTAGDEVILVDGGSEDATRALATPLVDRLISAGPGRALQMNAGAALASGEWLLFLHADTRLPAAARERLLAEAARTARPWGRFDLRLSGEARLLRLVERLINLRSRLTGIATGDQGIFVRRALFEQVGGYERVPLMEDVRLSATLRRHARPLCLRPPLTTSSRRWEHHGIWRTIVLMWRLRTLHALGVAPERLAKRYHAH